MRKRNRCPLGRKTRNGALTVAVFAAALASAPAMATWMAFDLDRNALERVPTVLLAGETRYPETRADTGDTMGPVVNGFFLKMEAAEPGKTEGAADVVSAPVLVTGVQVEVTGLPGDGPESGYMARSRVVQMFRNDTGRWIDGDFRFPLPEGARLGGLEVRIDGDLMKRLPGPDAEVGETGGGADFETAGFDPADPDEGGLAKRDMDGIEQGPGGLHVNVAEIEPGAVAAFIFDYSVPIVRSKGGLAQLTVPPIAMPDEPRGDVGGAHGRDFVRALAQTYLLDALPLPSVFDLLHSGRSAAVQIVLDAGAPLATLESPSHQFAAAMFEGAIYRISLVGDPLLSGRSFVLRWKVRSDPPGRKGPASPEGDGDPATEGTPVFEPGTGGISREGRMPAGLRLVGGSKAGYYYVPRVYVPRVYPLGLAQE